MTTKLGATGRNGSANGVVDQLDAGTLPIRSGVEPTNAGDASSGTLLATPTFGTPAFGAAAAGVATANAIGSDIDAAGSGDAGYFRCYPSGGTDTDALIQGKAGEAADSPEMEFNNKSIVAGGTVAITAFTYTQPAS